MSMLCFNYNENHVIDHAILHCPVDKKQLVEMPYVIQLTNLFKLNIQVNQGVDFNAWKAQWTSYSLLSRLVSESAASKVQVLTFYLSGETFTTLSITLVLPRSRKCYNHNALTPYTWMGKSITYRSKLLKEQETEIQLNNCWPHSGNNHTLYRAQEAA